VHLASDGANAIEADGRERIRALNVKIGALNVERDLPYGPPVVEVGRRAEREAAGQYDLRTRRL
jgi:hypothetical protein